ncbi:hypothetical protein KIN20_015454 [Parelaphostrongylus tenuis]|uniref:Uncharacterized protein n=1 Tax=Parelaphostrongylus tenuis TaxID=148309 RepID=A0AAD5QPW7_PARTN|nr:hypothetical protein KIN20_015454 [Parelaphostrongylus tenuis]
MMVFHAELQVNKSLKLKVPYHSMYEEIFKDTDIKEQYVLKYLTYVLGNGVVSRFIAVTEQVVATIERIAECGYDDRHSEQITEGLCSLDGMTYAPALLSLNQIKQGCQLIIRIENQSEIAQMSPALRA